MTIGSLAPWFGAKRTIAGSIVEVLGPHKSYWEPFCGSMAVLLSKPLSRCEAVNDLHADLVNLARVIKCPTLGPKFYRQLRRTLFSEALFRESHAVISEPFHLEVTPDLERAAHYFLVSWQGMNGVAGTPTTSTGFARRFSSLGGDGGIRWRGAVNSIPAWRKRLERVQVLSGDGLELCRKIEDRDGTVIYCDPPYIVKGAKYLHDFAADDHEQLAETLRRFERTRVVVSYYDHPKLEQLYPGWSRVHLEVTKSLVNQGKRDQAGAVAVTEVLLCNQPVSTGQRSLFGDHP